MWLRKPMKERKKILTIWWSYGNSMKYEALRLLSLTSFGNLQTRTQFDPRGIYLCTVEVNRMGKGGKVPDRGLRLGQCGQPASSLIWYVLLTPLIFSKEYTSIKSLLNPFSWKWKKKDKRSGMLRFWPEKPSGKSFDAGPNLMFTWWKGFEAVCIFIQGVC